MSDYRKIMEQWKDWRIEEGKQEQINEASLPKLQVPSDVSYYERDWTAVLKDWGNTDYGPREYDIYDWNDRRYYEEVKKEFNALPTDSGETKSE